MKISIRLWSCLAQFFLEWFSDRVVQEIKTHFMFNNFFFRKWCLLWDNLEKKYCGAGQATDDRRAHAHCMVDAWGYKDTHKICYTYCFSTAIMVTWTRLNFMLLVHCLSCLSQLHKPRNTVLVFLVERWVYPSPRLVCQATKRCSIKATQWIQMILKAKHLSLLPFIRRATKINTQ